MTNKILDTKHVLTFFSLTILINTYLVNQAIAQEQNNNSSVTTAFQVTFDPPQGDKPKNSKGAASRCTNCRNFIENSNSPIVPLIPKSTIGLTASSHPNVLVYFPETSNQKLLFSWRDENSNDHYQTILSLDGQQGIVSLKLPEEAPPLEIGKNYYWGLAVMTDGKLKPDSPTIEGQIQRIALEPDIRDRLDTANALETAIIYGKAGIWYETIATLAELKTAEPENQNLASNWQDLLNSVGLENISQASTYKAFLK